MRLSSLPVSVLASGLLLGITSISMAQSEQPDAPAQSQPVPSRVGYLNGVWEGSYMCRQGLTRLRLVIQAKSTSEVGAVFAFSAHPQNPNVPAGSFKMSGSLKVFNAVNVPDKLDLRATSWIRQPPGYSTVDLRGEVSPSRSKITGNVLFPGCTTFEVVRQESKTPLPSLNSRAFTPDRHKFALE
jgi:hypothetical protein